MQACWPTSLRVYKSTRANRFGYGKRLVLRSTIEKAKYTEKQLMIGPLYRVFACFFTDVYAFNFQQDHSEVVQGLILSLRSNGFIAYVPAFDTKGPVYLCDKDGHVQVCQATLLMLSDSANSAFRIVTLGFSCSWPWACRHHRVEFLQSTRAYSLEYRKEPH